MTPTDQVWKIFEHFMDKKPGLPKKVIDKPVRWFFWAGLLLRQEDGRYILLDRKMDDRLWERWFKHELYGPICYAFANTFHFAAPFATHHLFHIFGFEWDKYAIRKANLICTRCGKITQVESTWFRHFQSDLSHLPCCHKRFVKTPYWRTTFWGMEFYNSVIRVLNRQDLCALITIPPGTQFQTGLLGRRKIQRRFFGSFLQVFHNGEYIEVPGVQCPIF